MESFYKILKKELIHDVNFDNPEKAQLEIFRYIETCYNTKRVHSSFIASFQSNLKEDILEFAYLYVNFS
ncbi:IS3 family transposase [Listeria rocourtiae]|nr:transposase [Listeria rocourtiae FSL F6-920]MBC1603784.1 IS3 family transposase [Listeria rocourtiae]